MYMLQPDTPKTSSVVRAHKHFIYRLDIGIEWVAHVIFKVVDLRFKSQCTFNFFEDLFIPSKKKTEEYLKLRHYTSCITDTGFLQVQKALLSPDGKVNETQ